MNIGIICEYNPFHNGHLYQIEKIREEFGESANIISVMSGNYVQRGGVAITDKGIRAKCAVTAGANLVLELPFPFSMSSAEFFARSAIHVLNSLECIDMVSFGSESGSIEALEKTAEVMLSEEFNRVILDLSQDVEKRKFGHAALWEIALKSITGDDNLVTLTPNNILALEYIKAIKSMNCGMSIHTLKRANNDFSDESFVPGAIQSAMAIRNCMYKNDYSALDYIPQSTKNTIIDAIHTGDFPCDNEKLSAAIISSLRINSSSCINEIHDTSGGLYNRLSELSFKANTIDSLIRDAESKHFTKARIRRALFYSLLGVTSSQLKELPAYTQLLACDTKGRAILKAIGKRSSFPVLTKPSDFGKLSGASLSQKRFSDTADSIFQLTKPVPKDGNSSLRYTPFVKK